MVTIDYFSDLKQVQADRQLSRLLSAECQHAPFDRLEWWQLLERHCGLRPLIAVARDGEDVAVLPLTLGERGRASALANWYTFRFRPIVAGDPAVLRTLANALAGRFHRLTLDGVPDEDGSATRLESAFRESGWHILREVSGQNHVLAVNGRSFEQYLAERPGRLRSTLRRKAGKLETRVLTRFDPAAWDRYEAIYAESWKPAEGSPAFLRACAAAEGEAGRLRLGIACAAGQAIAAQLWTVEGGTGFIHKLAHREASRALSAGSVLTAALMRHAIDLDGVDRVDFGTGDDRYKRDWMEAVRPRYRLDLLRTAQPANWPTLAKWRARRLAAAIKRG